MTMLVRSGTVHTQRGGQRLFSVVDAECQACGGCGAARLEPLKLPPGAPILSLPDGPARLLVSRSVFNGFLYRLFGLPVLLGGATAFALSELSPSLAGPTAIAVGLLVCVLQVKCVRPNTKFMHLTSWEDALETEHRPFNITD